MRKGERIIAIQMPPMTKSLSLFSRSSPSLRHRQLRKKSRLGVSSSFFEMHRRSLPANSRNASEMQTSLYDFCRRTRHTTYQRDQESGLDYAMARYYANVSGRFASPDKGRIGLYIPASLNRYSYAGSDPINRTDSSGNEWVCREMFAGYYTPEGRRVDPEISCRDVDPELAAEEENQSRRPVNVEVRSSWRSPTTFDCYISRMHGGNNHATDVTKLGQPSNFQGPAWDVQSISGGSVVAVGQTSAGDGSINYIGVYDPATSMTIYYFHVSGGNIAVGQTIQAGSVLGMTDTSGNAAGRNSNWHVHMFAINGDQHDFSADRYSVAPFIHCSNSPSNPQTLPGRDED